MKSKIIQILISTCLLLIATSGVSQNAKKLYKSGKDYSKIGNFDKAVELYSQAIDLNPKFTKAFEARANAYVELNQYENAAGDFESLSELEPKKVDYYVHAGSLYCKVKQYQQAIPLLNAADALKSKNPKIYYLKSQCYLALKNYGDALDEINKAVSLNPSAKNFYQRGLVNSVMKNYTNAESDFRNSLQLNNNDVDAYNQLAFVLLKQNQTDQAIETLNNAVKTDAKNKTTLLLRSHIHKQKSDFASAIADLSKLVDYYPKDSKVLLQRGIALYGDKQYSNAINDFNNVLKKEKDNQYALEKRALSYEMLNNKKKAINDYKALLLVLAKSESQDDLKKATEKKLFELQREKSPPKLFIIQKTANSKKIIEVPVGPDETSIKIKIDDQSDISSLKIDGMEIPFHQDSVKNGQEMVVDIMDKKSLSFEITDVYNNKTTDVYSLTRKETGFPRVVITSPLSMGGNKIFLSSLNPEIEIKGRIVGNNKIKSIIINDYFPAQFNSGKSNPAFTATISIKEISELTFDVIDTEGNHLVKRFILDRSDAEILSENPMGRTWVIFIENSDYNEFTNLEGPKKEVGLMVKALSKYRIDKIIHKRNMTKSQMDWFFKYQLKKLVKENRVNSILLWYAGHGKFMNQNGFWIPVDSKVDDVSSYYNINSLKSNMKSYSDVITHSLVVTDACESGPDFYMSMRSLPTEKDCNDAKSSRFKSSQVFTSSGDDLADGDSQFTNTFANSLIFNNKSCIPIERIVTKVSSEVAKSSNKRPKFGKISGFTDENGTFIFIKK